MKMLSRFAQKIKYKLKEENTVWSLFQDIPSVAKDPRSKCDEKNNV